MYIKELRKVIKMVDREELQCFIDGNCLCVVKNDFINLQESPAVFIDLDKATLGKVKKLRDN